MTMAKVKCYKTVNLQEILRDEWTNFWRIRNIIGMFLVILLIILPGLLYAASISEQGDPSGIPKGPDGEAVSDKFYYVHKSLTGDGSITIRLTSMTGRIKEAPPVGAKGPGPEPVEGMVPWAKAGIMIKDGVRQGASYVAVMLTAEHGVRMQYNFTHDTAGKPGGVSAESPRWLRLTREGDLLTGYESFDGKQWTIIGTVVMDLPDTVEIGMFATSPGDIKSDGAGITNRFSEVTAVFDQVSIQGMISSDTWSNDDIGATARERDGSIHHPGGVIHSGNTFTVTGVGDIAPLTEGGWLIERSLIGVLVALVVVIIISVRFVTIEYRSKPISSSQLRRSQQSMVLLAKAVITALITFITSLAGAIITVPLSKQIVFTKGTHMPPVEKLIELRIIFGSAALLAVTAILATALAALLRQRFAAIASCIVLVLLPNILALANILPLEISQWLLRITPAAGFAVQQSVRQYAHVSGLYIPQLGYYPLAPWAGFAVYCCYAVMALGLAVLKCISRETRRA